jgi:hypothetical protein
VIRYRPKAQSTWSLHLRTSNDATANRARCRIRFQAIETVVLERGSRMEVPARARDRNTPNSVLVVGNSAEPARSKRGTAEFTKGAAKNLLKIHLAIK